MFQIHALPKTEVSHLYGLDDAALAQLGAVAQIADAQPGYPCRVSLRDAAVGERVILLNYTHQPADTPYRASHAIYLRDGAETCVPAPGEIPQCLQPRLISLRAFDRSGHMRAADIGEGTALRKQIARMLEDPAIDYLHLHNAKPGCFAARVTRA